MTSQLSPSICLITCYMGPLPNYFSYFISSCKKNKDIHFVVITDSIPKSETIENIELIKMTIQELSVLASKKLNASMKIANSWKINEYKPLFGILFNDLVKRFDFWGWCDLDIIWGDVRAFLTPNLLNQYDILAPKEHWTAGHFTLFRNNEQNNNLFRINPTVFSLLNSDNYFAFEECCHRWEGQINSIESLVARNLPVSMFDIVKHAEKEGLIKAHFKDIIREFPQPINYLYKNGTLTDLGTNEPFMYYHLLTIKKIWRFYIPAYNTIPDTLYFSPYGIKSEREQKSFIYDLLWKCKRAINCFRGIRKSLKKQGPTKIIKRIFVRYPKSIYHENLFERF